MARCASFPYKWQTLEIGCGLLALVSGGVFFLISAGTASPLWKILGGTFSAVGVLCTVIGASWCLYTLRTKANHGLYGGHTPDCEAETLTTENLDLYRG